jgi:8-oxo-dGTP diphosphatase
MSKLIVNDLKKGVDFIGVTCVFFCHDGKKNLLLHKRSKNCRDEVGRWDCGAGSMEFGETFEQTIRREIKEEYRLKPKQIEFCGATNVLRKNGLVKTHWIAMIFAVTIDPRHAKVGEPEKMDEIGLFPTDKLPKPLHSKLRTHLDFIRKVGIKI